MFLVRVVVQQLRGLLCGEGGICVQGEGRRTYSGGAPLFLSLSKLLRSDFTSDYSSVRAQGVAGF